MTSKTFKANEARTELEVWFPRYHDQHESGERVVLLAQYKVDASAPWITIKFTKAKHLQDQRYAISRQEAMKCPLDNNGKIPCYAIGMSKLIYWDTSGELHTLFKSWGWL